jgi:uncharacterized surface protein with fasciclin (FAS1) repeats
MKTSFHIVVVGLTLLSTATCAWARDGYPLSTASHLSKAKDIVDTAASARQFKTLTAALKAAGLVDTLKSKGPFTVFAPSDAAFAKLPAGMVESLLQPENKAKLTAILTYHVAAGKFFAKDVAKLSDVKTVQGSSATIKVDDGRVMVGGATVLKADIVCSNGVIHVIDAVILP